MKVAEGYYCLIQYCPDAARAEAANLGVLVFSPAHHFLAAKTADGNDRVRRFFKGKTFSKAYLNSAKSALRQRVLREQSQIRTLEELLRFIDTRGNDLVLTQPRSMRVENPEEDLNRIFDALVGGRASAERSRSGSKSKLKRAFIHLHERGLAQLDLTVHVPRIEQEIKIPFAYVNGAVNLIRPMRIEFGDPAKSKNIACRVGAQGLLLNEGEDEAGLKRKLVVVSTAPLVDGGEPLEDAIRGVFEQTHVKFVPEREIDNFLVRVESEAHK